MRRVATLFQTVIIQSGNVPFPMAPLFHFSLIEGHRSRETGFSASLAFLSLTQTVSEERTYAGGSSTLLCRLHLSNQALSIPDGIFEVYSRDPCTSP